MTASIAGRSPIWQETKEAILHRQSEVFAILGVSPDYANGRHQECLSCNVKKLRISDPNTLTGGCDACGGKWSNPVDMIAHQLRVSDSDALRMVRERLGLKSGRNKSKNPSPAAKQTVAPKPEKPIELADDGYSKHGQTFNPVPWNEKLAALFCSKNGNVFSVDTLVACGATLGTWQQFANSKPQNVIAIPVYSGPKLEIVNWTIFSATGGSITYREENKQTSKWETKRIRKRAAFSGSDRVGVSLSISTRNKLLTGERIPNCRSIKVEGQTDFLALQELHSGDASDQTTIIWTNSDGARSYFKNLGGPGWFVSMLDRLRPDYHAIIHDRDLAGVEGAKLWANILAKTLLVRNVVLPMEYQEKHGKDFRDWMTAGEVTLSTLNALIDSSAIHEFDPKLNEQIQRRIESSKEAKQEVAPDNDIDKISNGEHVDDPHRLATSNIKKYEANYGGRLVFYKSDWWKYRGGQYRQLTTDEIRAKVTLSIRNDFEQAWRDEVKTYKELKKSPDFNDKGPPMLRKVTRHLVSNVIGAMEATCLVSNLADMPCWLPDRSNRSFISLKNGLLDIDKYLSDPKDCLQNHSADWFSVSKLAYSFEPSARSPRWIDYLVTTMGAGDSRIQILQEWAGYMLFPGNPFQRFFVSEGEGNNGKTVYNAAIEAMLGTENVSHVGIEQFGERFALNSTLGKYANIAGDCGEIDAVAEGVLKKYTGGDPMQFDRKNREPINARPSAKLMFSWNHRPRIKDRSKGIWRRMLLMPFDTEIPQHKRVLGMDNAQWWIDQGEVPGILNWALEGLVRLLEQKHLPARSDATTQQRNTRLNQIQQQNF